MQWFEHPELLNAATLHELRTLVLRYPYFQSARLLYLYNMYLMHDEAFGAELRRSVVFLADARVLFYLIEGDSYRLVPQKQPKESEAPSAPEADSGEGSGDRTLTLIDSFLAQQPEGQFLGSELDYTTYYASYLLGTDGSGDSEAPQPAMKPLEQLEAEGNDGGETQADTAAADDAARSADATDEDADEGYFTETLAKIYIKQHRYEKALEIIKKLSLKYPKKNIYFADQIRFLEKLIENEKSKQL